MRGKKLGRFLIKDVLYYDCEISVKGFAVNYSCCESFSVYGSSNMKPWAKKFYASEAWQTTRRSFLMTKNFLCERCSTEINPVPATIVHHKVWLNELNINDPEVALSQDNLEALCQDCHNKEHHKNVSRVPYRWDENGNVIPSPPIKTVHMRGDAPRGRLSKNSASSHEGV